MPCCSAAASAKRRYKPTGSKQSWAIPGTDASPGSFTVRCFWTARTRAIPVIGPSSRSRARRHSVALVASGHLHRAHDFVRDGTRYIWAPSSAFLVGPVNKAPPMSGEEQLGAVLYEIGERSIEATIVEVPGLLRHWSDDVAEEVY